MTENPAKRISNRFKKMQHTYINGVLEISSRHIPHVEVLLGSSDLVGAILARCTINRMHYKVEPGIYAVGKPTSKSVVFVSANYKLSFDTLRSSLYGIDGWILALDTKGINVWCAAGKGTFGTQEIIKRIDITGLKNIVDHRTLIVPQLSAPGVAAHDVKKLSGFTVVYGPIRAADIPAFLKNNMQATPEMREVKFTFFDRIVLIPAEIATLLRYGLLAIAVFFILSGFTKSGYSLYSHSAVEVGKLAAVNLLFAYLAGAAIGPLLLPWLPGRSFSGKGLLAGIIVWMISFLFCLTGDNALEITAWMLLMPAVASFLTMNFTGATTYTSLSGVKKEMRLALPLQITFAVIGASFWLVARFR